MVRNIRNYWVIAANQAQTHERRRPSQSRSCPRSPLAVPANTKEHSLCQDFVRITCTKRHNAHIILNIMGCQLRSGCKDVPANTMYNTHHEVVGNTPFRFP